MHSTHQIYLIISVFSLIFNPLFGGDWSNPKKIGFPTSSTSDIGINEQGDVVALFLYSDNTTTTRVQSAIKKQGKKWQTLSDDLSSINVIANKPQVAVTQNGKAVAVWTGVINDGLPFIQTATFNFQKKIWTAPLNLTYPLNIIDGPIIRVDPKGNALCAWSIYDGLSFHIQSALLMHNKQDWEFLQEIIVDRAYELDLAIDPKGNGVLVWSGEVGTKIVIQGATRQANSLHWIQTDNLSPSNTDSFYPHIGVDQEGNAIATWSQGFFFTAIKAAKLKLGETTWQSTADIEHFGLNNYPSIAVDSKGNAVAIWNQFEFPNNLVDIRTATLEAGSFVWSTPTTIANAINTSPPLIVADQQGNCIATWVSNQGLQTALLPFKQEWSSPITSASPTNNIDTPSIAISPCSNAVISFTKTIPSQNQTVLKAIKSKKLFPSTSPLNLKGKTKGMMNILKWTQSDDPCVTHYLIHNHGKVIQRISQNGPFKYIDCLIDKKEKNSYTVSAVKSNGAEQTSNSLVFP